MKSKQPDELSHYINNQLGFFNKADIIKIADIEVALKKVEVCFSQSASNYFSINGITFFSETHSVQYAIFLWYLAKHLSLSGRKEDADCVYYLNKMLNSVDWYHEIDLPEVFGAEHPMGSVLGRAEYQSGLFVYQGTTVGGNAYKYPRLGKNVLLYSNATILGDCHIGDNVIISTGTTVVNTDIPSNSIVFQNSGELVVVTKNSEYMYNKMEHAWKQSMFENE